MSKILKSAISLIMCIAMLMCLLPAEVINASEYDIDDYDYVALVNKTFDGGNCGEVCLASPYRKPEHRFISCTLYNHQSLSSDYMYHMMTVTTGYMLTFTNTVIRDNGIVERTSKATYDASRGAVLYCDGGSAYFNNCRLNSNYIKNIWTWTGGFGAAMYVTNGGEVEFNGTNEFNNNYIVSHCGMPMYYGRGAAMYIDDGNVNFNGDVIFNGNRVYTHYTNATDYNATDFGSAIYMDDGACVNFYGNITLGANDKIYIDNGNYCCFCWILAGSESGNTPYLNAYQNLMVQNAVDEGHCNPLQIQVSKTQQPGIYKLASGDFSDLTNKDEFDFYVGLEGPKYAGSIKINGDKLRYGNYEFRLYTQKDGGADSLYLSVKLIMPTSDFFTFTPPEANIDSKIVYYSGKFSAKVKSKNSGFGNITVLYKTDSGDWSTEAPSLPGTYQVGIALAEGEVNCAVSQDNPITDSAWKFTIEKRTPKYWDFEFICPEGTFEYNGQVQPISVKDLIPYIDIGDYTVRYHRLEDGRDFPTPLNAGTYRVEIDVEENQYCKAINNLTANEDYEWTFTIEKHPITLFTRSLLGAYNGGTYTASGVWSNNSYESVDALFLSEVERLWAGGSATNATEQPVKNTAKYIFREGFSEDNYIITGNYGFISVFPANQNVNAPTVKSVTADSITLEKAPDGYGATSYGYNTKDESYTATWVDSEVITGLKPETTYYLFVRYAGDQNHNIGSSSATVAATSHTHYGGSATCTLKAVCDKCHEEYGELAEHTWNSGEVTQNATCAAEGIKTFTCTVCNGTKTEKIPATAVHTWNSGEVTTKATCAAEGIKTFTCTVCNGTKTEKIPATANHTWNSGEVKTKATCVAEGIKTYTCTVCNGTKTEQIPATASHTWNSGEVTTKATCVAEGIKTYTCTVCNGTKTEKIPATAVHTWNSGEITKSATCVAEGTKTYTCTVCGATKTEEIAKLTTHTYNSGKVTTAATCKDAGEKTFTCTVCGATKTEAITKLTTHTYNSGKITKSATCAAEGIKTYTCTVCGATKTEAIAKLTTHTYDSGKVTTAATCKDAGEKTFICTVCGATKIEAIAKLTTHTYNSGTVTKKATCTATGVKTYTCTVCKSTKTETIAKVAHTYKTVTTSATLTKDGKIQNKCSVCGNVKSTTAIAKIKTVTLSKTSATYTGKAIKPTVTVKDSKGKTVDSKYYTVTYKNNTNVGKATVTVKFKGNYSGTKTLTFKINPKATTVSKVTSTKKGTATVTVKKQATQTTGYEIQYSTSSKFTSSTTKTVKITSAKTLSKTISKLTSGKTYYFRVRTYKTVSKVDYTSAWSTSVKAKIK